MYAAIIVNMYVLQGLTPAFWKCLFVSVCVCCVCLHVSMQVGLPSAQLDESTLKHTHTHKHTY